MQRQDKVFVLFQPSLTFASKAGNNPSGELLVFPSMVELLAFPVIIRLGYRCSPGTNTLAYFDVASARKEKVK